MLIKVGDGEDAKDVEIGDVSNLMENEEFATQFQSAADSLVSKAVEAYKEKGFKSAVEKAVEDRLKAKETKTPEQLRIAELESTMEGLKTKAQEKELLEMKVKNSGTGRKALKDAELPDSLIDFLVSEDAAKTDDNVKKAVEILTSFKTDLTKKLLGENNTKVPGKVIKDNNGSLKEPGKGATKEQWTAYYKAGGK
jgi:hemerythrin superfamily protein